MDEWISLIFLYELKMQLQFALLADADRRAIQGRFETGSVHSMEEALELQGRTWASLHAFFDACAVVSKMLWPYDRTKDEALNERRRQRGAKLRAILSVANESPLRNKNIRNALEHIDDELDAWATQVPTPSISMRNIGPANMIVSDNPIDHIFFYNTTDNTVVFLRQTSGNLDELSAAIQSLAEKVTAKLLEPAPRPDNS